MHQSTLGSRCEETGNRAKSPTGVSVVMSRNALERIPRMWITSPTRSVPESSCRVAVDRWL